MSSVTSPRGPLPPRVYWVRRALVVLVALALVFVLGKVLAAFGGDGGGPAATTVSQDSSSPSPTPGASPTSGATTSASPTARPAKARTTPASAPTGTCDDGDVVATPTVTTVRGGGTVAVPVSLTSASGSACSWTVSSRTLVVKITSGKDRIWSSQDCTAAITRQDVVVRPAGEKVTKVQVRWNGHRSAAECAKGQAWAEPGWYHVVAASLGGQPADVQFQLAKPLRPTVTKTAKPTTSPSPTARPHATHTPRG